MVFNKDKCNLKLIRIAIISVSALFALLLAGHYILGVMGVIYLKSGEGQKSYEFSEDINADGKKENVKFINHYCSYYKKNTFDSEYTTNYIKLYLDNKQIYSKKITTLLPLLSPKIVHLAKNNKKKQIYVHSYGGGSYIPMNYYFNINNGKIVVSAKEGGLNKN